MNVAGIDVSAKELVVVVSVKGKAGKAKALKIPRQVTSPLFACCQNIKANQEFALKQRGFIILTWPLHSAVLMALT